MVSTKEHLQIPYGTGPGVRTSLLFPFYTVVGFEFFFIKFYNINYVHGNMFLNLFFGMFSCISAIFVECNAPDGMSCNYEHTKLRINVLIIRVENTSAMFNISK